MAYQTRVLLVCVANAARSQLAEALLRHTDPKNVADPVPSAQPDAFRHCLHEIHERIKMFVLVKTKR